MPLSARIGAGRSAPAVGRRATILTLIVLGASLLAPLAVAQTIAVNGNFDNQLPPWGPWLSSAPDPIGAGSAPVWTTAPDLLGSAASGSVRIAISATPSAINATSGVVQCVNFVAPTSVTFINYGFNFWVPASTTRDGSVSVTSEIRLFSAAGCSGFISGGVQAQSLSAAEVPSETWYSVGDTNFTPPGAPVMAASAEVRGYLRQNGGTPTTQTYAIHLDRSLLVLNDTTPVELTRFSVE